MTDPRLADVVRGAPLQYVSDYFSFVGADERGRVCFAIDNNRGYDAEPPPAKGLRGTQLQAEHAYAVLHDELDGWVALQGVTRYPHPGPDATVLPDSAWFTFRGSADTGLRLHSEPNDILLDVEPLQDRLVGQDSSTLFVMRTAAASLTWRGRKLPGRVTYDGLATTRMNMLSRRTFRGVTGMEFFYLLAGTGAGAADLYLQKALAARALGGLAPESGFASSAGVPGSADTRLGELAINTTAHVAAGGLHRWPVAWTASWGTAGPAAFSSHAKVELHTVSRRTVGRYLVAGFAMAVVAGTLTEPGAAQTPLYGFGELFAGGPLFRVLARPRD